MSNIQQRQDAEYRAQMSAYNAEHSTKAKLEKLLISKGHSLNDIKTVVAGDTKPIDEVFSELEKQIENTNTNEETTDLFLIGNGFCVKKSKGSDFFDFIG